MPIRVPLDCAQGAAPAGTFPPGSRGFTLTELVTVILIVGILAAVAVPRFSGRSTFDTRGYADRVRSTVDYAQKVAIAQRRNVCVGITASSVSVTRAAAEGAGTACTVAVVDPSTNAALALTAPGGVTTTASAAEVIFDALGQSVNAAGVPLTSDVTLDVVGDFTTTIRIEKITGYVH